MKLTLILAGSAFFFLAIPPASAQVAPAAPALITEPPRAPTQDVSPASKLSPGRPAVIHSPNASAKPGSAPKTAQTKVVQIYSGPGYFNVALAKKLRPKLTKTFPAPASNEQNPAPKETKAP